MAFSQDYLDFITDQFSDWDGVESKKMFGGVGLYRDGIMFGGIMGGSLHLKVDDTTRESFIERGMTPFFHGKKQKGLPTYYEVPVEIVEDKSELKHWAIKALAAAKNAKK